jgi:hypothetical protein
MTAPATMTPATLASRSGAHDRAGDDDTGAAGIEERRI